MENFPGSIKFPLDLEDKRTGVGRRTYRRGDRWNYDLPNLTLDRGKSWIRDIAQGISKTVGLGENYNSMLHARVRFSSRSLLMHDLQNPMSSQYQRVGD